MLYTYFLLPIVYHGDGTAASIYIGILLFDTIFLFLFLLLYFSYFPS